MDLEILGSVGGIAGILVAVMFSMIKHLTNQLRTDRRFMEDRLSQVTKDYNEVCKDTNKVQLEHTKVMAELYTWLKAKNGNK